MGAVPTVLVLVLGAALVWFALRADGDVVRKTDLFDGGVWVTNAEQARFGRLNKPAGQLDAGIAVARHPELRASTSVPRPRRPARSRAPTSTPTASLHTRSPRARDDRLVEIHLRSGVSVG